MNIIEHVWHYLKQELQKLPVVNTRDMLWNQVNQVNQVMKTMWSDKMTLMINDLYKSMPRRIAAVMKAGGGNTKY
jgi:hypothetical protein